MSSETQPRLANSSPPASESPPGSANKPPRLSVEQKQANHILSENKRRAAIREQYDKLATLVGLDGEGRAEARVLETALQQAREAVAERRKLIRAIEVEGGTVPEQYKKDIEHLEHLEFEGEPPLAKNSGPVKREKQTLGGAFVGS